MCSYPTRSNNALSRRASSRTTLRLAGAVLVFLACGGDDSDTGVGATSSMVVSSLAWTSPVGTMAGSHSVGDDGQFRYSMPLEFPSGRAGFTPAVRLSYASDSSVGVVGVGFQLDAGSAITRCGRTVAIDGLVAGPRYDDSDVFCLDGARLVPETPGSSVYRTASESHLRAEAHYGAAASDGPESWSVEFPDGTVGRPVVRFPRALSSVGDPWSPESSGACDWYREDPREGVVALALYADARQQSRGSHRAPSRRRSRRPAASPGTGSRKKPPQASAWARGRMRRAPHRARRRRAGRGAHGGPWAKRLAEIKRAGAS